MATQININPSTKNLFNDMIYELKKITEGSNLKITQASLLDFLIRFGKEPTINAIKNMVNDLKNDDR